MKLTLSILLFGLIVLCHALPQPPPKKTPKSMVSYRRQIEIQDEQQPTKVNDDELLSGEVKKNRSKKSATRFCVEVVPGTGECAPVVCDPSQLPQGILTVPPPSGYVIPGGGPTGYPGQIGPPGMPGAPGAAGVPGVNIVPGDFMPQPQPLPSVPAPPYPPNTYLVIPPQEPQDIVSYVQVPVVHHQPALPPRIIVAQGDQSGGPCVPYAALTAAHRSNINNASSQTSSTVAVPPPPPVTVVGGQQVASQVESSGPQSRLQSQATASVINNQPIDVGAQPSSARSALLRQQLRYNPYYMQYRNDQGVEVESSPPLGSDPSTWSPNPLPSVNVQTAPATSGLTMQNNFAAHYQRGQNPANPSPQWSPYLQSDETVPSSTTAQRNSPVQTAQYEIIDDAGMNNLPPIGRDPLSLPPDMNEYLSNAPSPQSPRYYSYFPRYRTTAELQSLQAPPQQYQQQGPINPIQLQQNLANDAYLRYRNTLNPYLWRQSLGNGQIEALNSTQDQSGLMHQVTNYVGPPQNQLSLQRQNSPVAANQMQFIDQTGHQAQVHGQAHHPCIYNNNDNAYQRPVQQHLQPIPNNSNQIASPNWSPNKIVAVTEVPNNQTEFADISTQSPTQLVSEGMELVKNSTQLRKQLISPRYNSLQGRLARSDKKNNYAKSYGDKELKKSGV